MDAIRHAMLKIVNAGDGMTVRHLFYKMVATGLIDKTEVDYDNVVCRLGVELRRSGDIPFGKIVDGSRLYTVPNTYESPEQAIEDTAAAYRRSYWRKADRNVEVWCEKDAVRALIQPITWRYAVPMMVSRGFSSESIVQSLAVEAKHSNKPLIILSLNDYDPSGSIMLADILRRARHYAPDADFRSEQVALTRAQVTEYKLPTRPTKSEKNPHAKNFPDPESVELDSLEPADLCAMLRVAIEDHIDPHELRIMEIAEQSERQYLFAVAAGA